jgi:hypothetical protein
MDRAEIERRVVDFRKLAVEEDSGVRSAVDDDCDVVPLAVVDAGCRGDDRMAGAGVILRDELDIVADVTNEVVYTPWRYKLLAHRQDLHVFVLSAWQS